MTYGSAGVGTGPQLAGELFVAMSQIKLTHVPYKGTNEALGDLMTGRISLLFAALPVVSAHIRDGRLKALGITTGQRSDLAPDIPTIAEFGLPGFDVLLWFGLAAPRGTPDHAVRAIAVGDRKHPEGRRHAQAPGCRSAPTSWPRTLDDFAKFIDADIPKWGRRWSTLA